ncbi:hypothetical protein [Phyllobacterium zundukense]|uniref:hypothetical protein n=1 Tax=Phyllobacterium zundukense TaxID=1867719 RepID=UPI00138FAD46|nr:hypothetical protein [Phyllobacterium zundukense]
MMLRRYFTGQAIDLSGANGNFWKRSKKLAAPMHGKLAPVFVQGTLGENEEMPCVILPF